MENGPLWLLPPLRTFITKMIQCSAIVTAPVDLPEILPERILIPGKLPDGKAILSPVQGAILGKMARVTASGTKVTGMHATLPGKFAISALVSWSVAVVADLLGTTVSLMATDPAEETGQFAFQRTVSTHVPSLVTIEAFWPGIL